MRLAARVGALLADIPEIPGVAKALRNGPDSSGMVAAVLMAVFVVVLLVVLWAVFIRKPARSAERGRLVDKSPSGSAESSGRGGRRRRKKREHAGRNPTLAETGGLPELKKSPQPPSSKP
jgi:hypothetical protein